jgi:hypothetical protein
MGSEELLRIDDVAAWVLSPFATTSEVTVAQ